MLEALMTKKQMVAVAKDLAGEKEKPAVTEKSKKFAEDVIKNVMNQETQLPKREFGGEY